MKIAFLGGSFNPPHKGHIEAADLAKKTLGVDMVVFLVTPHNPFKSGKELLPIKRRVDLLKALIKRPWAKVSTIETKFRTAESINTIHLLKKLHICDKIYFVLGTDNLAHFHKWNGFQKILKTVSVVFINRGGVNIHKTLRQTKIPRKEVTIIYKQTTAISSTQIRKSKILR
ncbi:MAG: nicotinate-nucleotide adenylyltransferase [Candidatus Deianiraeaceae bacterium]|jgi:nicotinate-nucleotide adenylyltransferase